MIEIPAHDRTMGATAAISTEAQDEALDIACELLTEQGERSAADEGWMPDDRYAAMAIAIDMIPDYDGLADKVAHAAGLNPDDGGLDNDPLTQLLHDVYSEARADAGGE